MKPDITKTIFRAFRDSGDAIALFPEVPYDRHGDFCMSYQQVGQHGAASPMGGEFVRCTRPATPEEIAPLAHELARIGYTLAPVKRVTDAMHRARRAAAREEWAAIARRCEDCGSTSHIEGSEKCPVSYPEHSTPVR